MHCPVVTKKDRTSPKFALSPTKLSFQTFLSSLRSYKSFFLPLRKCSFKKYFFLFDKCIGFKIGLERNGVFPTSSTCMIWKIKSSLVSFQPKFNNPYFLHAWPKLIFPTKISFKHELIPKQRKCKIWESNIQSIMLQCL